MTRPWHVLLLAELVEGFWSVVGRRAAQTQGIYLSPAAKHARAGFDQMRVYCGDVEVTPRSSLFWD